MGNNFFRFKQFTVRQEAAAMKVCVDSVLLGSWADVGNADRILDVGTGTGLLALMSAQRNPDAVIDAVEIDESACRQALLNVAESPWSERINVISDDFRNYADNCSSRYDLIISNPPFFTASLKPIDEKRGMARHNDSLPHRDLAACSARLLTPCGLLTVTLPPIEAGLLINDAASYGLYVKRILHVQSLPSKPVYRMFVEFSKTAGDGDEQFLCIEKADRTDYTDEYKSLTREFYLKF